MHFEFLASGSVVLEDIDKPPCFVNDTGQEADQMSRGKPRIESFTE